MITKEDKILILERWSQIELQIIRARDRWEDWDDIAEAIGKLGLDVNDVNAGAVIFF